MKVLRPCVSKKYSIIYKIFIIGLFLTFVACDKEKVDLSYDNEYYIKKCKLFAEENKNAKTGQIVFIGDSLTDLYSLDEYFSTLELETYNRGIGGDFTLGVLARINLCLYSVSPSKIVLLIGVNDLGKGRKVDDVIKSYEKILSDIKANLPNCDVLIESCYPVNDITNDFSTLRPKIVEINSRIEVLSEKYNYTYIDIFSHLVDSEGKLRSDFSGVEESGIHLNKAGYDVVSSLLMPYLGLAK